MGKQPSVTWIHKKRTQHFGSIAGSCSGKWNNSSKNIQLFNCIFNSQFSINFKKLTQRCVAKFQISNTYTCRQSCRFVFRFCFHSGIPKGLKTNDMLFYSKADCYCIKFLSATVLNLHNIKIWFEVLSAYFVCFGIFDFLHNLEIQSVKQFIRNAKYFHNANKNPECDDASIIYNMSIVLVIIFVCSSKSKTVQCVTEENCGCFPKVSR